MTEQERWQLILDNTAMLRSLCYATLRKLNCVNISLDELQADVVWKCWQLSHNCRAEENPQAWLHKTARFAARRCVLTVLRKGGRMSPIEDLPEEQHPIENSMIQQEAENMSLSLVGKLPARQAYIARAISEGQTFRAIAEQLGIDVKAVFQEWRKAQQTLTMLLQGNRNNLSN